MLNKFSTKLAFGFGLVLLLMFIVATISAVSLRQVNENGVNFFQMMRQYENIAKVKYYLAMESSCLRAHLYYKDQGYLNQYREYHDQKEMAMNILLSGTTDPVNRQLLVKIRELSVQLSTIVESQIEPLVALKMYEKASDIDKTQVVPVLERSYTNLEEYEKRGSEEFNQYADSVNRFSSRVSVLIPILSALATIIGIMITVWLTTRIAAPFRQLSKCANTVAEGDFNALVHIKGKDELASLGAAFNKMVGSLQQQRDELIAQNEELIAQDSLLARSLEQVNHERSKLIALNEFNEVLNISTRLSDLCQNIVSTCIKKVQATSAALCVIDPDDDDQIITVISSGLDGYFHNKEGKIDITSLAGRCLKEKVTLTVSYPETDLTCSVRLGESRHTAHEVYIPIIYQRNTLGILVVARLDENPFASDNVEFLIYIMRQGAIAINNALDHQKLEQAFKAQLEEIDQRKQAEDYIRHMAYHDTLTGLPNRKLFHERLTQELARAVRKKQMLSVMFLDLDGFKDVNDSYGHEVGDKLLQEVAKRLKSLVRESDIVSRLGGDEFTILLTDAESTGDIILVAQKAYNVLMPIALIDGHEINIWVSIGISIYPKDGSEPEELIRKADHAMYMAKKTGKNNYLVYTEAVERDQIDTGRHRNGSSV